MKKKTTELSGRALDYAVALAEGVQVLLWSNEEPAHKSVVVRPHRKGEYPLFYDPSTGPAGDDIIDRESITTMRCNDLFFPYGNEKGKYYETYWRAEIQRSGEPYIGIFFSCVRAYGTTRREAAMRCYVASKLGAEIGIPDQLL